MADSSNLNSIELNGLNLKTDSLPSDWLTTIINPKTGEPAENMTVARFIELFTQKQPEVTENTKGLMGVQIFKSNPGSTRVNRKYLNVSIAGKNAYRIKVSREDYNVNFTIKLISGWNNGFSHGVLEKVISYGNGSASASKVQTCSSPICNVYYISDPYLDGNAVNVDIINKANGINDPVIMIENYYDFRGFEFVENQTPRSEDLAKNNRDESDFALRSSVKSLAVSPNDLTETVIEDIPVSANTPMTLQEDGQPAPAIQTIERYEYSIPKMAEAILALQKELDELKGEVK